MSPSLRSAGLTALQPSDRPLRSRSSPSTRNVSLHTEQPTDSLSTHQLRDTLLHLRLASPLSSSPACSHLACSSPLPPLGSVRGVHRSPIALRATSDGRWLSGSVQQWSEWSSFAAPRIEWRSGTYARPLHSVGGTSGGEQWSTLSSAVRVTMSLHPLVDDRQLAHPLPPCSSAPSRCLAARCALLGPWH